MCACTHTQVDMGSDNSEDLYRGIPMTEHMESARKAARERQVRAIAHVLCAHAWTPMCMHECLDAPVHACMHEYVWVGVGAGAYV